MVLYEAVKMPRFALTKARVVSLLCQFCNSSFLFPTPHVSAFMCWAPDEADSLAGVAGIPL